MQAYLFVHPLSGLLAVATLLGAFALQAGKRKFSVPHYILGVLALVMVLVARSAAFWTIDQGVNLSRIFLLHEVHGMITFILLAFLSVQAALGVTMYFFRRSTKALLPFHRSNAYIIVGFTLVTLVLGLTTFTVLWLSH